MRPITYLKSRAADLVRQVSQEGRTVTITQNGEAKAILMGVEAYDRLRSALALLKLLARAEADVEARRTMPQQTAFRRAATALKRAASGR